MEDIWAITAYFNPIGYRQRRENYRLFRENLRIPLAAVELYHGQKPELDPGDADKLAQLPGRDVLWQKEHLLSHALRLVPRECRKVVWLDADLVFATHGWPSRAADALETTPLVQVFRELHDVDPTSRPFPPVVSEGAPTHSFAYKLLSMSVTDLENALASGRESAPRQRAGTGIGWAFRREVFESRGFYNGSMIGGNDRAMACAALGAFGTAELNWRMNPKQREHFRAWAEPFFAEVNGELACLDEAVLHLRHGSLKNRSYGIRHRGFERFRFDPWKDVSVDGNGALQWNSDKPEMHQYVRDWFSDRREDDPIRREM